MWDRAIELWGEQSDFIKTHDTWEFSRFGRERVIKHNTISTNVVK